MNKSNITKEQKIAKLNRLRRWQDGMLTIACDMEMNDEIILSEHIESIVGELEFQIKDLLKDGAIVQHRRRRS